MQQTLATEGNPVEAQEDDGAGDFESSDPTPIVADDNFDPDDGALSLVHLRAVQRVAEEGSVSKAAQTLFRAQSAVTRSVSTVERQIGENLFERNAKGMIPTRVGLCVLQRLSSTFEPLEKLTVWIDGKRSRNRRPSSVNLPAYLQNTRRLHVFSELEKTGHMPSVARTFNITQPAVSAAIRGLETGSSMMLFHRNARGLTPTPEGQTFAFHVRVVLNELRHIPADVAALKGFMKGLVVIGALPFCRDLLLPEMLRRLTSRYREVRFTTMESPYIDLAADVRSGDVDFIIAALRDNLEHDDLFGERLISEKLVVLAGKDHPLASAGRLELADIVKYRWILPKNGTPSRCLFNKAFRQAGIDPPEAAVETADPTIIRGLLYETDMIALSSPTRNSYGPAGNQLTEIDVPLCGLRRDIGVIYRRDSIPSPAAKLAMDTLRTIASEIAEGQAR